MKLKKYIEEKTSEWVGYQRPAVDWMVTEKGNSNSRLKRTMHDFPAFGKVVRQIPRPLSRREVFHCYTQDLYKGFVATLLWNRLRQEPFHIHHLFPFLVEPVDNVRARLKEIQNHLRLGGISIAELFAVCESSSKLQLAEKVNYKIITQAMDHLAMGGCCLVHPLMYNPRMRDVHCALLLEDEGTAQPFYDIDGDRVSIGECSSEAECYEDYCQRIGDIALWAGSGNPEFLVDWMNYSDEGMITYSIANEIIAMHRKKLSGSLSPSQNVISLSEFFGQGLRCVGDEDSFFANYASNLYMESEADIQQMMQILRDNDLVKSRTNYASYNYKNKGCNKENPFSICALWEDHFKLEMAIADYVVFWGTTEETHRELLSSGMSHIGAKWIESLTYSVYRNGKRAIEQYFFELTTLPLLH
jgi:hypothetical protein